jgi:transposase-like protein
MRCARLCELSQGLAENPVHQRHRAPQRIKRRTEVVGNLPNKKEIKRLVGAILLEQTTNGPSSATAT